jgi:ribosomal protein L7/L12
MSSLKLSLRREFSEGVIDLVITDLPEAVLHLRAIADSLEAMMDQLQGVTLYMTGYSGDKIKAIKAVRSVTSMGLKQAKDFVESLMPRALIKNLEKTEAQRISAKLAEVGITFEIA